MGSITITDIPKEIHIPKTMTYRDFVKHTLQEYDTAEVDMKITEYNDLTLQEQKELNYIASLDTARFVSL